MRAAPLLGGLAVVAGLALAPSCVESHSTTHGPASASTGAGAGRAASSGAATGFDKHALLANLGERVVLATYREFASRVGDLALACSAWKASGASSERAVAQGAWKSAMSTWQRAELMQLGPAAPMSLPGGKDLRDEIYSWPSVNACAVDQELVKAEYENEEVFANKLVNVRGLAALEHLLFDEDEENACAPQNTINAAGTWSAIVPELSLRRAAYATTLAGLVASRAAALRDAWEPSAGDYLAELATPGQRYQASAQEALNAVSDAMFYLDTETKDLKLAVPAGLAAECATVTCPEKLELRESRHGEAALRENLLAFQLLFHGGASFDEQALGFDDWLTAAGAGELSATMAADLAAALAAIDAIPGSDLEAALATEPKSLETAYGAVKKITDQLKTEFVTVLDLELPDAAATDND